MQLTHVFLCLLTAVSAIPAVPAPEAAHPQLHKRVDVDGFPPKSWRCVTSEKKNTYVTFLADYIRDSVNEGIRLRDAGQTVGGYPGYITSPESIPGLGDYAGQTNVDHFPLNYDSRTIFNGGSPTSDARVFYQHDQGSSTAKFLGLWTHAGRRDGTFVQCTENSV